MDDEDDAAAGCSTGFDGAGASDVWLPRGRAAAIELGDDGQLGVGREWRLAGVGGGTAAAICLWSHDVCGSSFDDLSP